MGSVFMSKQILPEEKIRAVKEYLEGRTSQQEQAKKLGVKVSSFQEMVAKYETFGEDGLLLFRKGGMAHTAELALCVPLVQSLLDLRGRLLPLPSLLWVGVYWIDTVMKRSVLLFKMIANPSLIASEYSQASQCQQTLERLFCISTIYSLHSRELSRIIYINKVP